jgi:hypothetical protein
MSRRWTKGLQHQWLQALEEVLETCFPRWREADQVGLMFTNRAMPGLIALCDRDSLTIALFPKAQHFGRFASQATIVHECCHLKTDGRHGPAWKKEMRRAFEAARKMGKVRLHMMLVRDLGAYNRRPVTHREIFQQLNYVASTTGNDDPLWIADAVADWAGWPTPAFMKKHPWLLDACREVTGK